MGINKALEKNYWDLREVFGDDHPYTQEALHDAVVARLDGKTGAASGSIHDTTVRLRPAYQEAVRQIFLDR